MSQELSTAPTRHPFWLMGVLLVTGVWCVWVASGPAHALVPGMLEIGLPVVLSGLTSALLWQGARRAELPGEFRSCLRWLAAGQALVGLGTLYVLVVDVLLGRGGSAVVGAADLIFMSAYPFTFVGLYRLRRVGGSGLSPWRVAADSAVFIFGVGVPLWTFALQPSLATLRGAEIFVSLTYPCLAFLGILAVNDVLLRCGPLPSTRAFHALLGGLALSWSADLVFTLRVTERMQPQSLSHLANLISTVSLALILVAAWWLKADPVPDRPSRPAAFSPVPLFTIVVVALWLARYLQVFDVGRDTLRRLLLGVLVLFLMLILREGLAARDGLRLATQAITLALMARFEALVEHSSDLIMVVDPEGRLLFASPAADRFLGGLGPLGQSLGDYIHPEDAAAWTSFLEEVRGREEVRTIRAWRMRSVDGAWRAFETTGGNLLRNPDVQGLVLNARDITDRRHLEEQLHQARKMDALGRLSGGIAHDFNNLLSVIQGNVELARMRGPVEPQVDQRLEAIQVAAARGAALTARLLAFTRRRSGHQTVLQPEKLLETLLPISRELLGDGIDLFATVASGAGCFRGNRHEVEQMILNLVRNAKEAMPEGGRLTLGFRDAEHSDPAQLAFPPPEPGSFLVLDVTDTGSGMDEEVRSHLFEPFFSTKGRDKGMGLVGVYGMVKASGGGIGLQTEQGRGTTLSLWFPRVAPAAETQSRALPARAIRGTETILLVEDEAPVREVLGEILRSLGYEVHVAGDADQARSFLRGHQGRLDLLVTDVIMPGDSGPKLAAEVVRDRKGLRVLYISGYTADELEAHGLAHPGALLLEKPFTTDQIGQRIREVLTV